MFVRHPLWCFIAGVPFVSIGFVCGLLEVVLWWLQIDKYDYHIGCVFVQTICSWPVFWYCLRQFAIQQRLFFVSKQRRMLFDIKDIFLQPLSDKQEEEEEANDIQDEDACRACLSAKKQVVYQPCGHSIYCVACFKRIVNGIFVEKEIQIMWKALHNDTLTSTLTEGIEFVHSCDFCTRTVLYLESACSN